MSEPKKSFASDNWAGAHPQVIDAIARCNSGHVPAYGGDEMTKTAVELFRKEFGSHVEVFFVFNGTAANVLSIKAMTNSYHGVICADCSHLNSDECGAPERIACKLLTVPVRHGKICIEDIEPLLNRTFEHHVFTRAISISQSTEWGTVYRPEEIKTLADFAHKNGMFLHVDGSRIANAAASLNLPLRKIITDTGVDALSFGGTKNGIVLGEAVVLFNPQIANDFKFIRKQCMQLGSKMRFISAQFEALLTENLWLKSAQHANAMAQLLAKRLREMKNVQIVEEVQANAIFAKIPPQSIPLIREQYAFHVWSERESIARWMTAFDTTEEDVNRFADLVAKCSR
jgi:threonine aldolase